MKDFDYKTTFMESWSVSGSWQLPEVYSHCTKSLRCSIPCLRLVSWLSDSCALKKIDLYPISRNTTELLQKCSSLHRFFSLRPWWASVDCALQCSSSISCLYAHVITILTVHPGVLSSFSTVSAIFASSPCSAPASGSCYWKKETPISMQECSLCFHKQIRDKYRKLERSLACQHEGRKWIGTGSGSSENSSSLMSSIESHSFAPVGPKLRINFHWLSLRGMKREFTSLSVWLIDCDSLLLDVVGHVFGIGCMHVAIMSHWLTILKPKWQNEPFIFNKIRKCDNITPRSDFKVLLPIWPY